jgi:hypothetical protein
VWQSITYAESSFDIGQHGVTPAFVVCFTPEKMEPEIELHLAKLMELAHYGRVGRINLYSSGTWGIKFASLYARSLGNRALLHV